LAAALPDDVGGPASLICTAAESTTRWTILTRWRDRIVGQGHSFMHSLIVVGLVAESIVRRAQACLYIAP
jgi:hypothetical protein